MHRREGAKFPWGKALGWVIPIALIIVVIIARSNAVDEGERRNRAMSRVIVTSESAIQTEVATRVVPLMVVDGTAVAVVPPTESAGDCNEDFVGLDASVEDAIARGYEINFAVIEESASPEEFISKQPDASREVAQVWRDAAANARGVPSRLLGSLAEIWELSATIPIDDAAAQADNLRSLTDVYLDLASGFEKCESTKSFVTDLRQEAEGLRQLANELN